MTARLGHEINVRFSLGLSGYAGLINISETKIDAKNNTSISVIGTYTIRKHPKSKSLVK
jgi:hypothetical protein